MASAGRAGKDGGPPGAGGGIVPQMKTDIEARRILKTDGEALWPAGQRASACPKALPCQTNLRNGWFDHAGIRLPSLTSTRFPAGEPHGLTAGGGAAIY